MDIPKIIQENKKAIVLIDVRTPEANHQFKVSIKGTGFIISEDGKFITNAHVYKAVQQNEMEGLGVSVPGETDQKGTIHYDRYPTKLLAIDEENDVALMQIISDKTFATVQES